MKPDLSILICTRNGIRTIAEAISCCEKEILSCGQNVEIIVVDNGSTDGTYEHVLSRLLYTKVTLRLYREQKPGKIYAFELGVKESRSDLVSIIDDDNFIETNFISLSTKFFNSYKNLGIIGSLNQLDEQVNPPDWFEWARGSFACSSPFIKDNIINDVDGRIIGDVGYVPGAGTTFRKKPLLDALSKGYKFYNDFQRGNNMVVAGEDMEMCWLYWSMGFRFGYDSRIRMRHSISPKRLSINEYNKLLSSIGAGFLGVDPFYYTSRLIRMNRIKLTWQWQLFAKIKQLVLLHATKEHGKFSIKHRLFRIKSQRIRILGAIKRILKERNNYSNHIRLVNEGSWTELRVR